MKLIPVSILLIILALVAAPISGAEGLAWFAQQAANRPASLHLEFAYRYVDASTSGTTDLDADIRSLLESTGGEMNASGKSLATTVVLQSVGDTGKLTLSGGSGDGGVLDARYFMKGGTWLELKGDHLDIPAKLVPGMAPDAPFGPAATADTYFSASLLQRGAEALQSARLTPTDVTSEWTGGIFHKYEDEASKAAGIESSSWVSWNTEEPARGLDSISITKQGDGTWTYIRSLSLDWKEVAAGVFRPTRSAYAGLALDGAPTLEENRPFFAKASPRWGGVVAVVKSHQETPGLAESELHPRPGVDFIVYTTLSGEVKRLAVNEKTLPVGKLPGLPYSTGETKPEQALVAEPDADTGPREITITGPGKYEYAFREAYNVSTFTYYYHTVMIVNKTSETLVAGHQPGERVQPASIDLDGDFGPILPGDSAPIRIKVRKGAQDSRAPIWTQATRIPILDEKGKVFATIRFTLPFKKPAPISLEMVFDRKLHDAQSSKGFKSGFRFLIEDGYDPTTLSFKSLSTSLGEGKLQLQKPIPGDGKYRTAWMQFLPLPAGHDWIHAVVSGTISKVTGEVESFEYSFPIYFENIDDFAFGSTFVVMPPGDADTTSHTITVRLVEGSARPILHNVIPKVGVRLHRTQVNHDGSITFDFVIDHKEVKAHIDELKKTFPTGNWSLVRRYQLIEFAYGQEGRIGRSKASISSWDSANVPGRRGS